MGMHVNDVGTYICIQFLDDGEALDISAATALTLVIKKPGGTVFLRTPTLSTDGVDGRVQYRVQTGEVDEVGEWAVQGRCELPDGAWTTEEGTFWVFTNLDIA